MLRRLSLIDMACLLPLLVEVSTTGSNSNKYLMRLLLIVRTARLLQLYRLLRLAKSAKSRQGALIFLTIMCIIVCGAITMQVRLAVTVRAIVSGWDGPIDILFTIRRSNFATQSTRTTSPRKPRLAKTCRLSMQSISSALRSVQSGTTKLL